MRNATNNYEIKAPEYSRHTITGTGFLAFREIPRLFEKYKIQGSCLDYGCGAGRSSRFLSSLGLQITAVDISPDMLKQASHNTADSIVFQEIKKATLPYEDDHFDVIFSSFVLFEIPSLKELEDTFRECSRVVKPKGHLVFVTGSECMYDPHLKWLTLDNNFPENNSLYPGKMGRILLHQSGITLNSFFWKEENYVQTIRNCGLTINETLYPLGNKDDGYFWKSEFDKAPYLILVAQKA